MSHPIPSFVKVRRLLVAKVRGRLWIDRALMGLELMLLRLCFVIYLSCHEPRCNFVLSDLICITIMA